MIEPVDVTAKGLEEHGIESVIDAEEVKGGISAAKNSAADTANSSSTTPSTFGTDSSNVLCMNGTRSLEIFLTAKQLYLWITLFREMHLRMFFYFTFSIESAHNC